MLGLLSNLYYHNNLNILLLNQKLMKKTLATIILSSLSFLPLGCSHQTTIPPRTTEIKSEPKISYKSEETLEIGSRAVYLILDAVLSNRIENTEDRMLLYESYAELREKKHIERNLGNLMDLCIKYDANLLREEQEHVYKAWIFLQTGEEFTKPPIRRDAI